MWHTCGAAIGLVVAVGTVVTDAAPPDWPAERADRVFTGEGTLSWFGARALAIGDCDGDGTDDLLIAARLHSEGFYRNGRVTVYSGATSEVLHVFDGEGDNDELGHRLDRIGDLDGDGRADILIGAYQHDQNRGRVYAYSGRTGELIHSWTGPHENAIFGWGVSNAGDATGDGTNDVLIGCVHFNPAGVGVRSGGVVLLNGRTGELVFEWTGEAKEDEFGFRSDPAGDVDGDGRPDVVIAARGNSEGGLRAGKVYVYSGRTGELIRSILGEAPGDQFGERLWGDFDLNGDRRADLLVGSLRSSAHGSDTGRVYVHSGIDGSLICTFTGDHGGDQLGYRLKTINDVDGDAVPEIAVSAIFDDASGEDSGSVFIYSGRTRDLLYAYSGESAGDRLGRVIQALGDLNNDGYGDFAIASPFVTTREHGPNTGRVYVYSGRTGTLLLRISGEAARDKFGYSVDSAGDVNRDGLPDFTVGAVYNDAGGADAGRAYVFLGRPIYLSHTEFRAGAPGVVTVTGSGAGEEVWLLASLNGTGDGARIGALGGLKVSLLGPILQVAVREANADGETEFVSIVPEGLANRTVHLQAVIRRGWRGRDSVRSNTVSPHVSP